jgi:hypothetical protein
MNENRGVAITDAKLGGEGCWFSLTGDSGWQINCLLSWNKQIIGRIIRV